LNDKVGNEFRKSEEDDEDLDGSKGPFHFLKRRWKVKQNGE